jgi:integrase
VQFLEAVSSLKSRAALTTAYAAGLRASEVAGLRVKDVDSVVSHYALWHFLQHEGVTFKKSLRASEQDRPDVARRRERWKARQARIDPRRLVFIDETWAKTNMPRAHGRCPRGQRLLASALR